MCPGVAGARGRFVADCVTVLPHSEAEVHIFEPDGAKALIQPAELLPDRAADQKERSRGLLDVAGSLQILVQATPAAVHWIGGPQAVQTKRFAGERRRRRGA